MPSVAILIGSPALGDLAQRWVAAGLMGPVVHLDSATVTVSMDAVSWQGIEGTLCSAEGAFPVRVQEALASKGALRGITVVWARDDTENVAEGMNSVGSFARRIIHQGTSPRLFDLIVPTRSENVDLKSRAQGWEQLVVVPEDRPELESPDAGWLNTRLAVTLHVAAAALGRLGGLSEPLPVASPPDPRAVSVWSRHGLGGEALRREAVEFLDRRVPDFCAPDIKPRQYAVFAEQWEQATTMVDWLRQRHDGQLRYVRVPPASPDMDLHELAAPPAAPTVARRAKVDDGPPIEPAEREAQWRRVADKELHAVRKSAGDLPPSALWKDTVRLLTAAVDGGELPDGFARSEAHGHRLVVQLPVVGPDRELILEEYPGHEQDVPELAYAPPTSIAAEALSDAAEELWDGTSGAVAFPALPGTHPRHHGGLMDDLVSRDREAQKSQRDRLRAVGLDGVRAERSAADLLWVRIMTDAIRSRLDADRWHKEAVADWPVPRKRATPASLAGWVLAVLASAFGAAWLIDAGTMNDLIGRVGLGPWDPVVAAVSSFGVAVVLAVVAFVMRPRGADDGYWRWRMALRLLLKQRAEAVYRETRRQHNALRIYRYWWLVLRDIFPLRGEEDEHDDGTELVVPRALQHGPVEVHEPYRDLVLNQAVVEPGWREAAVAELAELAYSQYGDESYGEALNAAFDDNGYMEGALHRLQRDLPGTWMELRASWIDRAVHEAKDRLVGAASKVGGAHRSQLLSSFLDEVREGTAPTLWHALEGMEQGPEERISASTQLNDAAPVPIACTMPSLASAVLVVLRPLRSAPARGDFGRRGYQSSSPLPGDEDDRGVPY